MAQSLKLDQIQPSRQARCNAWLAERGVTKADLARELGVSVGYIYHIIVGNKRPPHMIERLHQLGIPRELLPEPKNADRV